MAKSIWTSDIGDFFKSNQERFFTAIKKGDLAQIREYLAKGAEINTFDTKEENLSPLMSSTINYPRIAMELLNHAADPNLRDSETGNTPLLTAARYGHTELVKAMLQKGGNINAKNYDGTTPLMRAIAFEHTATALVLIEMGADITLCNKYGNNALLVAAICGDTRVVKKLLKKGADINVQNHEGNTALILAAEYCRTETCLTLLENNADVNILNNGDRNALMRAAWRGLAEIAQALINAGSRLDVINEDGNSILKIATSNKHDEIERMLRLAMGLEEETPEAETAADKTAKTDQTTETWQKMGEERMSFIGTYPAQQLRLTEIYNFTAREKITIIEDLDTGSKTPHTLASFNTLAQPALEQALEKFEEQGGSADREFALHGKSMLKHKPTMKQD